MKVIETVKCSLRNENRRFQVKSLNILSIARGGYSVIFGSRKLRTFMNHIAQEVVWPCIIQDSTKASYHITVGKHFSKKKKAIWKFHQTYIQIFPFTIGSSFTQSRSYIYPVLVYIFRSFTFKINVIIISFNMKERHYSLCSEYHSTRNAFGQHWKLTTNNSRLTWKLHHSFLAYCLRCPALNAHLCQRNNSSLKPIKSIYFHQKWKHFHINLVLW